MTRRLGIVLLACAALGSLAFAGLRIARAKEPHQTDYEKHVRIYGTTPALAAATLASLQTPKGFHSVKCFGKPSPEWGCWSKSPSMPIDVPAIKRLVVAMGARPYSAYEAVYHDGVPAVQCSTYHYWHKYRLGIESCQAEALKGDERLLLFVQSFVSPTRGPTTRIVAQPTWNYPTEVNISVVGHFEHEGLQPGEER